MNSKSISSEASKNCQREDYMKQQKSLDEITPVWAPIVYKGVKTDYYISNTGLVCNGVTGKLRPLRVGTTGYYITNISIKGVSHTIKVHRYVAIAFCYNDDPENKIQVDHIDGNKLNNWWRNLEWVTPKENVNRAMKLGLCNDSPIWKHGQDRPNVKYSDATIRKVCELLEKGYGPKEIGKTLNINPNVPACIKYSGRWRHISKDYNFPKGLPKGKNARHIESSEK